MTISRSTCSSVMVSGEGRLLLRHARFRLAGLPLLSLCFFLLVRDFFFPFFLHDWVHRRTCILLIQTLLSGLYSILSFFFFDSFCSAARCKRTCSSSHLLKSSSIASHESPQSEVSSRVVILASITLSFCSILCTLQKLSSAEIYCLRVLSFLHCRILPAIRFGIGA